MMRIYIVRHAIAGERDPSEWPDDSLRPLTRDGAKRFHDAARGLRRIVPEVDAVLSSPYVRASETAAILERSAGWPAAERCDELTPDHPPSAVVEVVARRSESSIAVVGHEPHLSGLASYLLTGTIDGLKVEFRKGAVASLVAEQPVAPGSCTLEWLLPPRALRRLAN